MSINPPALNLSLNHFKEALINDSKARDGDQYREQEWGAACLSLWMAKI